MMANVIPIDESIESWENVIVNAEYEDVNPVTVKLLGRDFKYVYTYIKRNGSVNAINIFQRFQKFDVEQILIDLRLMHLVYFSREVK